MLIRPHVGAAVPIGAADRQQEERSDSHQAYEASASHVQKPPHTLCNGSVKRLSQMMDR